MPHRALSAGIQRLVAVAVTGFGAGDSRRALSFAERIPHRPFLGTAYADKDRQEQIIRDSDLDWLIVRPTILTNGRGGRPYKVLLDPDTWRNGLIARRDVADFLVAEVSAPRRIPRNRWAGEIGTGGRIKSETVGASHRNTHIVTSYTRDAA